MEAADIAGTALDERVAATCGALNRLFGELVDQIAELLADNLWQIGGIRSPEHWVQWRTGLSGNHAAELVRIARRSAGLPHCTAALRDGTMSLDQLDVVARNVPDRYDADVVDIAQMSTVAQLNRALSKMPFTDEPDTAPPPSIDEVRTTTDRHGRYRLRACGPADQGTIIDRALHEARDALFAAGQTDVTDWDALVEIAQRSLDTITTPTRRDRYRAYIHLDTNGGWLNNGPHLPHHLVDQLTCDGTLRPVWETNGRPVALGRTTRTVPEDLRRLILDRDRGCRHPACLNRRFLDIHHLVHWNHGGTTDPSNLLALCGTHHRAHHAGELSITGDPEQPDGLIFRNRHGVRILGPQPKPPDHHPPPGQPYPGPTGETFHTLWWNIPDRPPPNAA